MVWSNLKRLSLLLSSSSSSFGLVSIFLEYKTIEKMVCNKQFSHKFKWTFSSPVKSNCMDLDQNTQSHQ